MSDPDRDFQREREADIAAMAADDEVARLSSEWLLAVSRYKYSYNFQWLGRPTIQFPADLLAMQEIIWSTKPDLIVETGVAHGGSLVFYASLLELLGGDRLAVGVDVEIRAHNRRALEDHPLSRRMRLLEGSSTATSTLADVRAFAAGRERVLVALDSNHTHAHVLEELHLYSPLVKAGSYLVVFDTVIEEMPDALWVNRPWGKGDSPATAICEFLTETDRFVRDRAVERKLLTTVAPGGYLRCVRD